MTQHAAGPGIRAMVVEDHKPFLDYICSVVGERPDTEVVGKVQSGIEAVEHAAVLQPDLIFLDIGLPGLNGLEAAHRIRKVAPVAKIIFLTQEMAPEIVHEAFSLGAWGYVIKTSSARDLSAAILAVMSGRRFISEGLDGDALDPISL